MQRSLLVLVCVSAAFAALSSEDADLLGGPVICVPLHCAKAAAACLADDQCSSALFCDFKCFGKPNQNGCYYLCEAIDGYNLSSYAALLRCMKEHECFPKLTTDGVCIGNNSIGVRNLTDIAQLKGTWWIVRGLNCGQEGWPGAFDAFPCQLCNISRVEGGQWVTHFTFCGGSNNTCSTRMASQHANASIDYRGVITHDYTDIALHPQVEYWRVISWPHPDWILSVYCGYTPILQYSGGLVMDRSQKPIPAYVEAEFRSTAKQFGFDYDAMCINDVSKCPNRMPVEQ